MSSLFASPFFASGPSSQASSFHPLFRLLDDYETHNHSRSNTNDSRHPRLAMKSFTPKFDVKETVDAYELYGDIPGIEQKDIEIEFTDAQTLTIKGRTERSHTADTTPAGFVEDTPAHAQGAIEEGKSASTLSNNGDHKATVEDEEAEAKKTTSTEVATKGAHDEQKAPAAKYWVSERSVGEFSRSFSFPVRVDTDAVKASMKNGVLAILVPKAKKQESRKITIGN